MKNEIEKKKTESLFSQIMKVTCGLVIIGGIVVIGNALESIKINGETISKLRKLSTESLQTRITLAVTEKRYSDAAAINEILKSKETEV